MMRDRFMTWFLSAVCLSGLVAATVCAADMVVAPVSRVEVVLADQYRTQAAALTEEFARAGLMNVHFQFAKLGHPPQNIGLGREVPAEQAREAIRLAVKYNLGVGILLPQRLFPPRFVTIASSNYDDTVETKIDHVALAQLQNPALSTEEFHRLYRALTTMNEAPGRY